MSLPTRREIRDGAAWTGLSAVWLLLIVLVIAGISGILWALGVFTSSARGAGNVQRDTNSAANREHWSATYNTEFQRVTADQGIVAMLKNAAAGPGATQQDRVNYLGAQANCRADVAQYNAATQNVLGRPWLPDGLPTTLNAADYCGS